MMPNISKLSAPAIGEPLSNLINICISTSTWPSEWKLSNVTPIFKKDDPTLVSNYSPVSVLSALSKILEKVIFEQMYEVFSASVLLKYVWILAWPLLLLGSFENG